MDSLAPSDQARERASCVLPAPFPRCRENYAFAKANPHAFQPIPRLETDLMARAQNPSGPSLLDKSAAKSGSIDMSIFTKKSGADGPGQGTVSSDYLQKTREDNPDPETSKTTDSVTISNCKITTPLDRLAANRPFEMSVELKSGGANATGTVSFNLRLAHISVGSKLASLLKSLTTSAILKST
jgi:hypothetical protein